MEVAVVLVPGRHRGPAIPSDAERLFATRMGTTTVEVAASHAAIAFHPDEVTQLTKTAAGHGDGAAGHGDGNEPS